MSKSQNTILFNRFYCGGAVCSPTRASHLTGRTPNRVCMWDWIDLGTHMHLPHNEFTIAHAAGLTGHHQSIHVGKWCDSVLKDRQKMLHLCTYINIPFEILTEILFVIFSIKHHALLYPSIDVAHVVTIGTLAISLISQQIHDWALQMPTSPARHPPTLVSTSTTPRCLRRRYRRPLTVVASRGTPTARSVCGGIGVTEKTRKFPNPIVIECICETERVRMMSALTPGQW